MQLLSDIPQSDLKEIVKRAENIAFGLENAKILITGSTGFVGTWLTKALMYLNQTYSLGIEFFLTSRNVAKSQEKFKIFPNSKTTYLEIDYLIDSHLPRVELTHIIFSSTPSQPTTGGKDDLIVEVVSRNSFNSLVEVSKFQQNPPIFCNLSSGGVYGKNLLDLGCAKEAILPMDASLNGLNSYGKIKVELELEIQKLTKSGQMQGTSPRLFAFAGPGISLDAHFAVGNFIKNALDGDVINIKGNPNTMRSYLYPTDLTVWLLNLLTKPTINPIHIGSENLISISDLAQKISTIFSSPGVSKGDDSAELSFYVPETSQTRKLLSVTEDVTLDDSLLRWKDWLTSKPRN
jgi:dTDP-glucose 4,6-dehydratase